MSETPSQQTRRALRFVMASGVVTALGLVGVVLRPSSDETPATTEQKQAARAKIRCRGSLCFGALEAPSGQCAALAQADGFDPDGPEEGCPGDDGFVAPTAGKRLRRLLHCARERGAMTAWHTDPVLPGETCFVSLKWSKPEARAWVERLDAESSTALLGYRLADLPVKWRRDGGRVHTWAGIAPSEDGEDGTTLDADPLEEEP